MTDYAVDHQDLTVRVYDILKEMILRGELQPGQKLAQDELAETLGVSRTPLLSALYKLDNEMLVESLPRRGFVVRRLSPDEFVHVYDLRLRLEPLGAAEAATEARPEEIEELTRMSTAFDELSTTDREGEIKVTDYHLHMQIMGMSRNQILYNIVSSFNLVLISNMEGLLKAPQRSAEQHRSIIRAIEARDSRRAEQAMHFHLEESREEILRRKEKANGAS